MLIARTPSNNRAGSFIGCILSRTLISESGIPNKLKFAWRSARTNVFLSRVRRLKTILAMTLLVLWMPATSFCLMENAGWLTKNDGCCDSQSSEMAPCCALASAIYKMDDSRSGTAPTPAKLPLVDSAVVDLSLQPLVCAVECGVSPPELAASWQFSSRAAPAPRAPSSVS